MTDMHTLRTLGVLAFGFGFPAAGLADLQQSSSPVAQDVRAAVTAVFGGPLPAIRASEAEVAVAFDGEGRIIASNLRRSTGSRAGDQRALVAATEVASLSRPADVAGRTLMIRTSFDQPTAMD